MRTTRLALLFALSTGYLCFAQEAPWESPLARKVHFQESNVITPSLIVPKDSPVSLAKCVRKLKGKATLTFIVDSIGSPRDVVLEKPTGDELDFMAVRVVQADRFVPATLKSEKIAVGRTVEMGLEGCLEKGVDQAGKETSSIRLKSWPEQKFQYTPPPGETILLESKFQVESNLQEIVDACENPGDSKCKLPRVGNRVSALKAIMQPEARFSDYAQRNKIQGSCRLDLIVDAHGLPRNIHI